MQCVNLLVVCVDSGTSFDEGCNQLRLNATPNCVRQRVRHTLQLVVRLKAWLERRRQVQSLLRFFIRGLPEEGRGEWFEC